MGHHLKARADVELFIGKEHVAAGARKDGLHDSLFLGNVGEHQDAAVRVLFQDDPDQLGAAAVWELHVDERKVDGLAKQPLHLPLARAGAHDRVPRDALNLGDGCRTAPFIRFDDKD